MNDTPSADAAPPIEPVRRVQRDGTEFVLLGTAHVSRASVAAVEAMLGGELFDAVAVELCRPRAEAMRNPDALRQMDLFSVLREGRAATVAAGLALGAWQRRLAQQFGIEPGAEMVAAMDGAADRRLPCWLVDRDVGLTLRRARAAVGFWERAKLSAGLLASLIDDSEIDEADIEQLKERDVLENAFTEFGKQSPPIYRTLIAERDAWMAARLREEAALTRPGKVLVVIGAGHLAGIAKALESETAPPTELLAPLRAEPPPSRAGRWFGAFLLAFVIGGFVYGFSQGLDVGVEVLWIWVLTGLGHGQWRGGAVGAQAARGRLREPARRPRPLARLVAQSRRPGIPRVLPDQLRHRRRRVDRRRADLRGPELIDCVGGRISRAPVDPAVPERARGRSDHACRCRDRRARRRSSAGTAG